MLDVDAVDAAIREVITNYPQSEPYLRKVAERVAKTGALRGRVKLGARLPQEIMIALRRLFPNVALATSVEGACYLRMDRLNISDADADAWMTAFCAALDIARISPATRRAGHLADTAVVLDRCRLSFPELSPVWEMLAERQADIATQLSTRGAHALQDEYFQLANALRFLLAEHEPLGLADLSARCFGDSKTLKTTPSLLRRLEEWLLRLRDEEVTEDTRRQIRESYGVVENLTAIKVMIAGPLIYYKRNERFDWIARLHAHGESATLSWDNLRGIDKLELPPGTPVITCENETPFGGLLRDGRPSLLIYTAGYPNSAVCRLLQLLPPRVATIAHWGDSDLDGLRIASILHQIRPVQLWRCNLPELQRHRADLLPITLERQQQATSFYVNHPDFPFHDELEFTIAHGWLEQERWRDDNRQ